jgi:hypothetical protein
VVTAGALLADNLEQAARRMMVDLLLEQTAAYWRARAETFRRVGTLTADETARACEARAHVSLLGGDFEEYVDMLDEALAELGGAA